MGGSGSKDRMMGGSLAAAPAKRCKAIKLRHAGGYVDEFDRPVMTQEVMELHARHWVTQPDIFRVAGSHLSVLPPHTLLRPGHTYFLVPFRTLYCRLLRQAISKSDMLAFLSQQGLSPAEFHAHLQCKPDPGYRRRLTGKAKRGHNLSHNDHHHRLTSTHQIRDPFDCSLSLKDDRHGANHKKKASTDQLTDSSHHAYHQKKASTDNEWPLHDDRYGVFINDNSHKIEYVHVDSKKKRLKLLSDHVSNHDLNLTSQVSSTDYQNRALNNYGINEATDNKKVSNVRRHPARFHKMKFHENAFKADHNCPSKEEFHQKTRPSLQSNSNTPKNRVSNINPKDKSTPVTIKSAQTKKYATTPADKEDVYANEALELNQQKAGRNNTKTFNQGSVKALEESGSLKSTKDKGTPGFETSQESFICAQQDTQNSVVNTIKPPLEPKTSEPLNLQCVPERAPLRQTPSLQRSRSVQDHAEMQRENHVDQLITNAECSQSDMLYLINRNDNLLNGKQHDERDKTLSSFISQAKSNPEVVITKKSWSLRELMIQSPLKREDDNDKNEISNHESTHVGKHKSSTVAKCDQEETSHFNRPSDQTPCVNTRVSNICNQQYTIGLRKLHRRLSRSRFRSHSSWEPSLQPVHEYSSD